MNQVYFYDERIFEIGFYDADGLNPFMNQVYFYSKPAGRKRRFGASRLNPFMNQVYFYVTTEFIDTKVDGLNPFMNQVYFYYELFVSECQNCQTVLIPL